MVIENEDGCSLRKMETSFKGKEERCLEDDIPSLFRL